MTPTDPLHMPLTLGGQTVPGLWRFLLPPALLRGEFPAERRATCGACPMVAADGFRPDYRCCTYHPRIPAFLLGLALAREVSGKAVRALIDQGFVLPEGTERTPAMWEASLRQGADGQWGKGDTVLCPILDRGSGFCRLHAYRNATCSTYFCLYDFGARSAHFWEVVQEYVGGAEAALGQWSLAQAGFDLAAYFERFDALATGDLAALSRPGGGWSDAALAHLWGDWRGRELELLQKCAAAVSDRRDELVAIAAATPVRRPAVFEAAELAALPAALDPYIDARDLAADGAAVLPPVPLGELGALATKALAQLWALPRHGRLVRLQADARLSDAGILRFLPQEGDEAWELAVSPAEAEALRFFAIPQRFSADLLDQGALAALPEAARFVAEWLGYGVLIEV